MQLHVDSILSWPWTSWFFDLSTENHFVEHSTRFQNCGQRKPYKAAANWHTTIQASRLQLKQKQCYEKQAGVKGELKIRADKENSEYVCHSMTLQRVNSATIVILKLNICIHGFNTIADSVRSVCLTL